MEIIFAVTPSENGEDSILTIKADGNERISVGQEIDIELTDGTYTKRVIASLEKWHCPKGAKRGKWAEVYFIQNGESADALVKNIQSNTIQTASMPRPEELKEWERQWENTICLTPYIEIQGGSESIYDYLEEGYTVPYKVIAYLKTTKPFSVCLGIYEHPFKPGTKLPGPYLYTDDIYYWDRDTWKYVVKYGLKLPQDFIDHVMSDEGTRFLESQAESNESWSGWIQQLKQKKGVLCLLPEDAGDMGLEDF